jgi:hypothetical protein
MDVKPEQIEGEYEPEGLQPEAELQIPQHFSEEEWVELTKVIITILYHVHN